MVSLACLISPLANRTDQAGGQRSEEKKKEGRKDGRSMSGRMKKEQMEDLSDVFCCHTDVR